MMQKELTKQSFSRASIGQTHSLDPAVQLPDGSHMDVVKGFKPERWLDEATKPTEYMPFGYGPRYGTSFYCC